MLKSDPNFANESVAKHILLDLNAGHERGKGGKFKIYVLRDKQNYSKRQLIIFISKVTFAQNKFFCMKVLSQTKNIKYINIILIDTL